MPPEIAVLTTGGTIASTAGDEGATPTRTGADLIRAVPPLGDHADPSVVEVCQRPSYTLTYEEVGDLAAAVRTRADDVDGFVVTHGTDTMEESAFAVGTLVDVAPPVVFTGAQRRPDEIGSDGPHNLLTAVTAATTDELRAAGGVYVAFGDELHAARDVTKVHTSQLQAFASPGKGPVAERTRNGWRFYRDAGSRLPTLPCDGLDADVRVVASGIDAGANPVSEALAADVDGLVLQGTGLGNVTIELANGVADALLQGVPVVMTSRCPAGHVAPVYGTAGGGDRLDAAGVTFAADLTPQKARHFLAGLHTADVPMEAVDSWFDRL